MLGQQDDCFEQMILEMAFAIAYLSQCLMALQQGDLDLLPTVMIVISQSPPPAIASAPAWIRLDYLTHIRHITGLLTFSKPNEG